MTKHLTEEHKRKIGLANAIALKGIHHTEETNRKISIGNIGKHMSDEARMKISKARLERKAKLGYLNSPETRLKISQSNLGKSCAEQIVVHHINGNHEDNRPENILVTTRSEHINIHRLQGDLKHG